jgi:hypothetical protein
MGMLHGQTRLTRSDAGLTDCRIGQPITLMLADSIQDESYIRYCKIWEIPGRAWLRVFVFGVCHLRVSLHGHESIINSSYIIAAYSRPNWNITSKLNEDEEELSPESRFPNARVSNLSDAHKAVTGGLAFNRMLCRPNTKSSKALQLALQ